ncbi:hypothetical protein Leryth_010918 [Lithospermum erythrorhizon]|uniref:BURP domain-containing protein n=1 Tax=Lithospermum erythrorhizon TaxID=34254 RepID=A0AAV3NP40_LITER|nr:hypothetical protein Leryth_010918 [Lithospermum erythrorhizon]
MQPLVVLISTFTLIFVACNASLPSAELYWNSVLPNTPMPKTIQDRLMSGSVEDWGVNKIHPDLCAFYIFFPLCIGSNVKAQDDPRRYIFLTENDLKLGTKKSLYLMKSSNRANFLPQKVNDLDPSTSKNIIATIDLLLSQPNSSEAKDMKNTINMCEESSSVEEDDSCATTLEEMIDFTTSRLGNNVSTLISEADTEVKIESYSISDLKNMKSEKSIVCHKLTYPYAVYKCHSMSNTRAYRVSVVNTNRKKINVGVICHLDTSRWNPEHLAFDVLNVKPGTTPVCHIVPGDSIAWLPNQLPK